MSRSNTAPKNQPPVEDEDGDLDSPQRLHTNSRATRIAALNVGETYSECRRIQLDDVTKDELQRITDNLNGIITNSVHRAKARTGHTYSVERGSFITHSKDIILVVAATRTA